MSESYYKVLGIDENASKEQIKKAYRSLSMKWHPDKNPGNADAVGEFQKIGEAYETLGNDEKREAYDMSSKNPFARMSTNQGMNHPDMESFVNAVFGNMGFGFAGPFAGMPGMPGIPGAPGIHVFHGGPMGFQQAMQKPTPIIKNIEITIEQVLNGTKVPLEIERWIIENGNKVFEKETLYLDIFQGIDENEVLLLINKGNIVNDNIKGDVKVMIKVINNTEYKRSGLDLILQKEISLKDSLCGFSFEIKYINGKSYSLNNNNGNVIQPGHQKVIAGLGLKRENHTGNLIIQFQVKFPERLTPEQIEKLNLVL
jgi:DnaJ-class molecular chaperone